MKQYTFPKPEHLCLRIEIDHLFSAGSHSLTAYPLRAVYREVPYTAGPAVKVLMSVSKRRFKHAVDRNRAKRQMREAYRLNKPDFLERLPKGTRLHLAFLWLAEQPVDSKVVQSRVKNLMARISEKISSEKNGGTQNDEVAE